jgi:cytoskeletal protein CcmA (bactofilin family)
MSAKPSAPAARVTVISAGSELQGDLRVRGALRVDGAVYGNVTADGHVALGPDARILGEVRAQSVAVGGRIDGIVRVRELLQVLRGGVVRGHARYQTLEIERGGVMDGSTSRGTDMPDADRRDEDEYAAAE